MHLESAFTNVIQVTRYIENVTSTTHIEGLSKCLNLDYTYLHSTYQNAIQAVYLHSTEKKRYAS